MRIADKGTDYTTIQAAIDDADIGDEIHVDSGTYVENVDVNKQLTLIGEGADVVTVQAADAGDHVFEVTDMDWVNISGFAVTGATDNYKAGIYLYSTVHCNISNNIASNNCYGIYCRYCSNTIIENIAHNNSWNGIALEYSNNNILTHNIADNNLYGIAIHGNGNTLIGNMVNNNSNKGLNINAGNTLSNNILSGNKENIYIHDGYFFGTTSIDTSNFVDGKPIYYLEDVSDVVLDSAIPVVPINACSQRVDSLCFRKHLRTILSRKKDNSK